MQICKKKKHTLESLKLFVMSVKIVKCVSELSWFRLGLCTYPAASKFFDYLSVCLQFETKLPSPFFVVVS